MQEQAFYYYNSGSAWLKLKSTFEVAGQKKKVLEDP